MNRIYKLSHEDISNILLLLGYLRGILAKDQVVDPMIQKLIAEMVEKILNTRGQDE